MLVEVRSETLKSERQAPSRKVWYHSMEGDLYVWQSPDESVAAFQVTCFDEDPDNRREWWVEWGGRGRRAGLVDSKETDSREHDLRSPTVDISSGGEAYRRAAEFLRREGGSLPPRLVRFLSEKLAADA